MDNSYRIFVLHQREKVSNEEDKEASKIEKLSLVEDMPNKNKVIEKALKKNNDDGGKRGNFVNKPRQ
jgi:hypothetical protein